MAAPDPMISALADLEAEMIPLGRPRPAIDERLRRWTRHVAGRELRLLAHAAQRASADHVVPLYADLVLPRLATPPSRGIRLTTLLFYPRGHYPDAFGMHLPFGERARAAAVSRPFRDDAGAAVDQRPPATTGLHTPQA